jgi:hypothetical protein
VAEIYTNFRSGTITDNPLVLGATTINSAAFASLPVVTTPDFLYIVLDPDGSAGTPEIVKVTAHTAAATSATVVRGQQTSYGGSVARQHATGTVWRHALTAQDLQDLPHRLMTVTGDIVYASAANTPARLAIGATDRVLKVSGGVPAWGQVNASGLASDAVTTAKILDGNVTTAKIADAAVTTAKLEASVQATLTEVEAAWTTWTPTLTQDTTVTKTVTLARYVQVGKTVHFVCVLAVTGTGSAGDEITITLPVTAAWSGSSIPGSGYLYDDSIGVNHHGNPFLKSTTTVGLHPAQGSAVGLGLLGLVLFTAALASGDTFTISGTYEAA